VVVAQYFKENKVIRTLFGLSLRLENLLDDFMVGLWRVSSEIRKR